MLSSISCASCCTLVLTGESVTVVRKNETKRLKMKSPPILVAREYVVTEDKKLFKVVDGSVTEIGKVPKIPTKLFLETKPPKERSGAPSTTIYMSDRLGSVYRISPEAPDASEALFGSISMITDLCAAQHYIVTVDKDSKVRITHKNPPYLIEKFVLAHARPLAALCVLFNRYVLAGGYDAYLSIYDMVTEKVSLYILKTGEVVPFDLTSVPEVEDASSILNIGGGVCRAKKILATADTLVVITEDAPIVIRIEKTQEGVVLEEVKETRVGAIKMQDGAVVDDFFVLISQQGDLYEFSLSRFAHITHVENYTPKEGLLILKKC